MEEFYGVPSAHSQVRHYDMLNLNRRYSTIMKRLSDSLHYYKKPEDFVFSFQASDTENGIYALSDLVECLFNKGYEVNKKGDSYIVTIPSQTIEEAREVT